MTREQFITSIKPVKNIKGKVLLTWYDENNDEFVVYIDKRKFGKVYNYQYKWEVFICNITEEEFYKILDDIPEGSIGDNQKEVILSQIKENNGC